MKYQHLVSLALAAALLTGCGGTQSSPSAAADQSSDSSRSTPGAVAQAAQTDRITDQYTLEKNVSGVWGEDAVQYISVHVPQLECDSPDAAYINGELNAIYAADFREFENSEEAGQPGGEYPQIGVGWDDWWYGDCVSLVVRSRYGGTAPWRYSGWCFDFATGRQLTVAEMLQRMGLDPDEVQQQVQRQAMQAFDREMAQGAYYEGLRLGGELSQMRIRVTAMGSPAMVFPSWIPLWKKLSGRSSHSSGRFPGRSCWNRSRPTMPLASRRRSRKSRKTWKASRKNWTT